MRSTVSPPLRLKALRSSGRVGNLKNSEIFPQNSHFQFETDRAISIALMATATIIASRSATYAPTTTGPTLVSRSMRFDITLRDTREFIGEWSSAPRRTVSVLFRRSVSGPAWMGVAKRSVTPNRRGIDGHGLLLPGSAPIYRSQPSVPAASPKSPVMRRGRKLTNARSVRCYLARQFEVQTKQ
jgi:hypothetical protein